MSYVVYCHTSPFGKKYVGCTSTSPEKRFNNGRGYEKNIEFWNDICKYGWDSFKHDILYTDLDELTAHTIETELINEWNLLDPDFGYNLYDGAGGKAESTVERIHQSRLGTTACVGRVLSDTTKSKISNSLKAYYSTHDGSFKGKHHTAETIAALSNRTISDDTRRKMRENHADCSGANNPSAKSILQFTKDGKFVSEYEYAKQASDKYNIDLSSIIKCCRNKAKSAGGYVWKYA